MDVSLVEADGIPEGCLISVRAGDTRRQAPIEAHKPCKLSFPKGVSYAKPFSVDLLVPLGSAAVDVNPDMHRYPFEVKSRYGGKPMHVTLRVREESIKQACTGNAEIDDLYNRQDGICNDSPVGRHHIAPGQRDYLDSHNLFFWLEGLLRDLARDKPDDPWNYIDACTARARTQSNGYIPAPTQTVTEVKAAAEQAKLALTRAAACGELAKALPDVREAADADVKAAARQAALALTRAASSGELAKALPDTREPEGEPEDADVNAAARQAALALTNSAASGALAKALPDGRETEGADVNAAARTAALALTNSAASGELARALPDGTEICLVKAAAQQAARALARAASSGELAKAVADARAIADADAKAAAWQAALSLSRAASSGELAKALADARDTVDANVKAAARQAAQSLSYAASSGELAKGLSDVRDIADADIAQQVARTLSCAASSGELAKALSYARDIGDSDVKAAARQAALSLSRAASSGELAKALADADVKAAARQAALSLSCAASSGELAKALVDSRETSDADVKRQAALSLLRAAANGELKMALAGLDTKTPRTSAWEAKRASIRSGVSTESNWVWWHGNAVVPAVKLAAREAAAALMLAASSGELDVALADVENCVQMEQIARRAREALLAACSSGSLSKQMREVQDLAQRAKSAVTEADAAPEVEELRALLKETRAEGEAMRKELRALKDKTVAQEMSEGAAMPRVVTKEADLSFVRKVPAAKEGQGLPAAKAEQPQRARIDSEASTKSQGEVLFLDWLGSLSPKVPEVSQEKPKSTGLEATKERGVRFQKMASVGTWCVRLMKKPEAATQKSSAASESEQGAALKPATRQVPIVPSLNIPHAADVQFAVPSQPALHEVKVASRRTELRGLKCASSANLSMVSEAEAADVAAPLPFLPPLVAAAPAAPASPAPAANPTVLGDLKRHRSNSSCSLGKSSSSKLVPLSPVLGPSASSPDLRPVQSPSGRFKQENVGFRRQSSRGSSRGSPLFKPSAAPRTLVPLATLPSIDDRASSSNEVLSPSERFKSENDSLRRDNSRLKKHREAGDAANTLCSQNDMLRAELAKLMGSEQKKGTLFG